MRPGKRVGGLLTSGVTVSNTINRYKEKLKSKWGDYMLSQFNQVDIQSYERSKLSLAAIKTCSKRESKLINSMNNHCDFVIRWLTNGQQPPNIRDVSRLSYVQRERLCDSNQLSVYMHRNRVVKGQPVSDEKLQKLQEALSILTEKQRECFVMAYGEGMSLSEIAELVGIKKGTVQGYIKDAKKKLRVSAH